MCGLVGAFRADDAPFTHKIADFMQKGLYVSAVRGVEGTGVGIVDRNWNIGHAKSQFDAATFLQTDQYAWAKKEMFDARVILGHTRHSTVTNSVSQRNSHPFHWSHKGNEILLTHNGHINNAAMLSGKGFTHQVDSAHFAYALLLDKDVKILEQLMGFYVGIWYDKKEHALKMARNNTRDLYYVYNKAKTQIYYASEAEILDFVITREGIDAETGEFHEIEPGELLVWDLAGKTLANPKKVVYAEKKSSPHSTGTQGNGRKAATSGAGGYSEGYSSSSPFSTLGRVDPQGPAKQHDTIYIHVDMNSFKKFGNPSNAEYEQWAWGTMTGTRVRDPGSTVKITGIQQNIVASLISEIQENVPCIVNKSELVTARDGVKLPPDQHYWNYDVSLDRARANLALDRVRRAKQALTFAKAATGDKEDPLSDGSKPSEGGAVVPFVNANPEKRLVPGPGPNDRITLVEWLEMAEMGCFTCNGQILPVDLGKVAFYAFAPNKEDRSPDDIEHQMICPTCRKDLDMEEGGAHRDRTKPIIVSQAPVVEKEARLQ